MRCRIPVTMLFAVLAAPLWGQPDAARTGKRPLPPRMGAGRANQAQRLALLERWNEMSPEERQKRLERLPPERRRQIEERLAEYRSMTPDQREQLRMRVETFSLLSPEKQAQARRLFHRFTLLPQERQQPLRDEFQRLRDVSEAERRARMSSEDFRKSYTPHERRLLFELTNLLNQ